MKNIVKKSIKGIVSIGCLVGLCLSLNGATKEPVKHKSTPIKTQQLSVQQPKKENKGMLIKSENWLKESDDENKDLKGNVIIEDGDKVVEISKDTYDEIEHGENSDLKGDIYLGAEDILNESKNVMLHQVESLSEFEENFKDFNILDSKDDGKYYTLKLNNGIEVKYEIDCDMFYVNGEDYECLNNAKKCVEKLLKDNHIAYRI